MKTKITVDDDMLQVNDYSTADPDAVSFFRARLDSDRPEAFDRVVRVGSLCLLKAQQATDIEFVRAEVDKLVREMQTQVSKVPEQLAAKLGSGEGQVLHPVVKAAEATSGQIAKDLTQVRALFTDKIDPDSARSTLGAALHQIANLLDPKRSDSLQSQFHQSLAAVSDADGLMAKALSQAVLKGLEPSLKSLRDRLQEMEKHVLKSEAAAEIAQQTTIKGYLFEDELLSKLQIFASYSGAELEHCGKDNQKGDFLLQLRKDGQPGVEVRIVVEAKADACGVGRKKIAQVMTNVMSEREAQIGLYVGKTSAAFAKEIAELDSGNCRAGRFVTCTVDHVVFALRYAICMKRIDDAKTQSCEIDANSVLAEVHAIRIALQNATSIRKRATDAQKAVDGLKENLDSMQEAIQSSLFKIESAIKSSVAQAA